MPGLVVSRAEFARMWADLSISIDEIGRRLGIGRQGLCQRAKARGLPGRGPNQRPNYAIPVEREAEFRAAWEAGVSSAEMCRRFGVREWSVRKTAARLGCPARRPGWRPPSAHRDTVRRLFDAGLSWGDIAQATGSTVSTVRFMARRMGLVRTRAWRPTITLEQWREEQIAEAMRREVSTRWAA